MVRPLWSSSSSRIVWAAPDIKIARESKHKIPLRYAIWNYLSQISRILILIFCVVIGFYKAHLLYTREPLLTLTLYDREMHVFTSSCPCLIPVQFYSVVNSQASARRLPCSCGPFSLPIILSCKSNSQVGHLNETLFPSM